MSKAEEGESPPRQSRSCCNREQRSARQESPSECSGRACRGRTRGSGPYVSLNRSKNRDLSKNRSGPAPVDRLARRIPNRRQRARLPASRVRSKERSRAARTREAKKEVFSKASLIHAGVGSPKLYRMSLRIRRGLDLSTDPTTSWAGSEVVDPRNRLARLRLSMRSR